MRRLCLAAWGIGWLVVAALLLMPVSAPPAAGSDLLAHVVLFAAMAFAAVTFCHHAGRLLLLTLLTAIAGAALELAQGLVPYRDFDLLDVLADVIGCGFGYAAALIVLYLAIRPSAPPLERTGPSRA